MEGQDRRRLKEKEEGGGGEDKIHVKSVPSAKNYLLKAFFCLDKLKKRGGVWGG